MRSRLYRHKQHENNRKLFGLLLFILILTVFMVTVGFRLLINSAVFVSALINPPAEDLNQGTEESEFYGRIELDEPRTATNAAQIYLSGTVKDYEKVDIYINNTKATSLTVKGQDSFIEKIGPLKQGENTIYAIARVGTKHTKESSRFTVFYKKDALKLDIETPTPDLKTSSQDLKIKGATDPGSTLKVNSQPVVIDFSGEFESVYRLKEGENILLFIVTDVAGNTVEKEVKVIYQKED